MSSKAKKITNGTKSKTRSTTSVKTSKLKPSKTSKTSKASKASKTSKTSKAKNKRPTGKNEEKDPNPYDNYEFLISQTVPSNKDVSEEDMAALRQKGNRCSKSSSLIVDTLIRIPLIALGMESMEPSALSALKEIEKLESR